MPTVAEVLIRSRDQYSKLTDQAKRDIVELGRTTKMSMAQAKDSADILKDTLGVHLPRELTKLLAHSRIIGPALAGAFSGVAVLGFISVLGQLPELYDKLKAKVAGWDEASQKAYENLIENNKKALEGLVAFQAKLTEITQGQAAGLRVQLADAQARLAESQRLAVQRRNEAQGLTRNQQGIFATLGLVKSGGKSLSELTADAEKFQKAANEAADQVRELNRQLLLVGAEETQKSIKDRAQEIERASKTITEIIKRNQADLLEATRAGNFALEQASKVYIDLLEERSKAAEEQLKNLTFWEQQLLEFRNRTVGGGEDVRGGEQAADRMADKIIRNAEELKRKNEEFFREFRQGAGEVWDVFATRGQNVLTSLANLTRGLLNTIGRTLFQNFATGLLTGARGGRGLGATVGNLGASIGLSTGLSGLFGGGAAAPGVFSSPGIFAGGALAGPSLAAPSLTGGGIAGALGLGGGAGLFGLGAATIPVFGGLALAAYGIFKWLHHKTVEAPFTTDPNSVERNRSILFFTSLSDAAEKLNRFADRMTTVPAGHIVIDGLPAALQSSNQFRRGVASTLLDDDL